MLGSRDPIGICLQKKGHSHTLQGDKMEVLLFLPKHTA